MRVLVVCLSAIMLFGPAMAQFEILDAKTTASLRGIDAVNAQVAWASGSSGTILLTTDGGGNWKHCAVPPGGKKLDFRGVQGFDAMTAVVMASGKGPASAIYKTTDGCATWKMVFANPDAEGFFDGLLKTRFGGFYVMGDQVGGKFTIFSSDYAGEKWTRDEGPGLDAVKGAGGFAASNSSLIASRQTREGSTLAFATSATETEPPKVYSTRPVCQGAKCMLTWVAATVPLPSNGSSSGIFSLAAMGTNMVAIGGNYSKPSDAAGTATYSLDQGLNWQLATTMPSGYRSAVVYDASSSSWLAVGPSGTDVSKDNGKNWMALRPAADDATDADQNWNAISLPFVVGGKGKIGKLRAGVLGK